MQLVNPQTGQFFRKGDIAYLQVLTEGLVYLDGHPETTPGQQIKVAGIEIFAGAIVGAVNAIKEVNPSLQSLYFPELAQVLRKTTEDLAEAEEIAGEITEVGVPRGLPEGELVAYQDIMNQIDLALERQQAHFKPQPTPAAETPPTLEPAVPPTTEEAPSASEDIPIFKFFSGTQQAPDEIVEIFVGHGLLTPDMQASPNYEHLIKSQEKEITTEIKEALFYDDTKNILSRSIADDIEFLIRDLPDLDTEEQNALITQLSETFAEPYAAVAKEAFSQSFEQGDSFTNSREKAEKALQTALGKNQKDNQASIAAELNRYNEQVGSIKNKLEQAILLALTDASPSTSSYTLLLDDKEPLFLLVEHEYGKRYKEPNKGRLYHPEITPREVFQADYDARRQELEKKLAPSEKVMATINSTGWLEERLLKPSDIIKKDILPPLIGYAAITNIPVALQLLPWAPLVAIGYPLHNQIKDLEKRYQRLAHYDYYAWQDLKSKAKRAVFEPLLIGLGKKLLLVSDTFERDPDTGKLIKYHTSTLSNFFRGKTSKLLMAGADKLGRKNILGAGLFKGARYVANRKKGRGPWGAVAAMLLPGIVGGIFEKIIEKAAVKIMGGPLAGRALTNVFGHTVGGVFSWNTVAGAAFGTSVAGPIGGIIGGFFGAGYQISLNIAADRIFMTWLSHAEAGAVGWRGLALKAFAPAKLLNRLPLARLPLKGFTVGYLLTLVGAPIWVAPAAAAAQYTWSTLRPFGWDKLLQRAPALRNIKYAKGATIGAGAGALVAMIIGLPWWIGAAAGTAVGIGIQSLWSRLASRFLGSSAIAPLEWATANIFGKAMILLKFGLLSIPGALFGGLELGGSLVNLFQKGLSWQTAAPLLLSGVGAVAGGFLLAGSLVALGVVAIKAAIIAVIAVAAAALLEIFTRIFFNFSVLGWLGGHIGNLLGWLGEHIFGAGGNVLGVIGGLLGAFVGIMQFLATGDKGALVSAAISLAMIGIVGGTVLNQQTQNAAFFNRGAAFTESRPDYVAACYLADNQMRNINSMGQTVEEAILKIKTSGLFSEEEFNIQLDYFKRTIEAARAARINPALLLAIWGEESGWQLNMVDTSTRHKGHTEFGCLLGESLTWDDQMQCAANTIKNHLVDYESGIKTRTGPKGTCAFTTAFDYVMEAYGPVCTMNDDNDRFRKNLTAIYGKLALPTANMTCPESGGGIGFGSGTAAEDLVDALKKYQTSSSRGKPVFDYLKTKEYLLNLKKYTPVQINAALAEIQYSQNLAGHDGYLQCVGFVMGADRLTGGGLLKGIGSASSYARDIPPDYKFIRNRQDLTQMQVGDYMVFSGGDGHIAVVIKLIPEPNDATGKGSFVIAEGNGDMKGTVDRTRSFPITYGRLVGWLRRVQ